MPCVRLPKQKFKMKVQGKRDELIDMVDDVVNIYTFPHKLCSVHKQADFP